MVERALLLCATGVTTYEANGAWRNGGTEPQREKVVIVESFLDSPLTQESKRSIVKVLQRVAKEAGQEALAVVIDNRLYLIVGDADSNGGQK